MEMYQSNDTSRACDKDTESSTGSELLARQTAHFSPPSISCQLLNAMPSVVFILNKFHQIIFANKIFCELIGIQNPELLYGKRPGDVLACRSAIHGEYGCGSGDACRTCGALAAITSAQAGHQDVQECLLTRQDNEKIEHLTLRVWTMPITLEGETYTILSGFDISHERRRIALEKTFFHDILNLIGSIRGFAELLELNASIDLDEVSKRIQHVSQRVIDEIDTQRVLLAAEKGELQVEPQLLYSRQVLAEVVALFADQDISQNRSLELDDLAVDIPFLCDAVILRRILINMCKNALEATPPGGKVFVGVKTENQQIEFWVLNWPHIPMEVQSRIFQRDFSTKGAGRGLGTYSMKLLTQILGGEISFSSSEKDGTKFMLTLPVFEQSPYEASESKTDHSFG
jgi:signal transduction histidine kinase